MGSAIFFDLVGAELPFPAFAPRNLIIRMVHPFAGTSVPAPGRCEAQWLSATSGRPTRATHEDPGLKKVADLLQKGDKLG